MSKENIILIKQKNLFIMMLDVTIFLIVADTLGRFDGLGTFYYIANHVGNFLLYALSIVIPSLWILYVSNHIYKDQKQFKKIAIVLLVFNVLNLLLDIISQFNGWYYYIDSNNIYHRGPFLIFTTVFTTIIFITSSFMVLLNKKKIEKRYYFSLIFFAVPPFIGVILQAIFYGTAIVQNGIVISLLLVFLKIQNISIHTDYLTGVYNRKELDKYLENKINSISEDKSFLAIMIDLNNFKYINDTYGHAMGDNVLKTTANLLKSCIKTNDFIARYGGDEFCVIMDTTDNVVIEKMINKINKCLDNYNAISGQPYKVSFSMGYSVYDNKSDMEYKDFQRKIDKLMYENKLKFYKK